MKKLFLAFISAALLCSSCAAISSAASSIPWWKCASWCTLKLSDYINAKAEAESSESGK